MRVPASGWHGGWPRVVRTEVVILPADCLLPSSKRGPGSESPQFSWVVLSWAVSLWGICFLFCLFLGTSRGSGDCGQDLPHLDIW